MTHPTPLNVHAAVVSELARLLSTRTLNHFAEEARLDGESLQEAVERYDIDYAWHVLGSQRLLDATVVELQHHLARELTAQQRADVAGMLEALAAEQATDLLMSFDNDLASQLAHLMMKAWGLAPSSAPSAELA